jgi:hypothetical protein
MPKFKEGYNPPPKNEERPPYPPLITTANVRSVTEKTVVRSVTEKTVTEALENKFKLPWHAFFPQFRDATGWDSSRTADAISIGLYSSHGLELRGFEIKVNRSDWLTELKATKKAMAVLQYCDQWWIATIPGIVKPDEVPNSWGIYELKGKKLIVVREAKELKPVPMEKYFLASIVQRALGGPQTIEEKEAGIREDVAYQKGLKEGEEKERKRHGHDVMECKRIMEAHEAFEEKTGLSLWDKNQAERVVEQIRLLQEMQSGKLLKNAKWMLEGYQNALDRFKQSMEEAKKEIENNKINKETK